AASRGRRLVEQRGCLRCHSSDGKSGVGPTWKGLSGSGVKLTDGRTVKADRDYLIRAIAEPDADTVSGFPPEVMAGAIPGRPLSEAEIADIVGYLETL
ncbi:MAG: c-type cytochrome, partial [Acidimicrobiales bacterium]